MKLCHRYAAAVLVAFSCFPQQTFAEDINATEALQPIHLDGGEVAPIVQQSLNEASADFAAVIAGKCPVFAKFDKRAPLLADGGTLPYNGNGYSLVVVQSLTSAGILAEKGLSQKHVDGYLYGPVINFDPKIISGNGSTISHVTFYSRSALKALFANRGPGCTQ